MALLQDLIQQIDDPALRDRILKETNKLAKNKKFGLVFEDHLPECTPLYDVPIRVGSKVALKNGKVNDFYVVQKIQDEDVLCDHRETHELKTFNISELAVIAEFGEPIYPTLKPIDYVENAPDSDLWHTLIEADNYHALQLLEYLYAGKVDCIYIDPPYNTGAKDWKYNNDYVDGNDAYRHSKWLSMMEKRLMLAKKLLNPINSVLIVTIDEKEYLHLGCLLEELYPEAHIQMISVLINRAAVARDNEFSRSNEYIFVVFFGEAGPAKLALEEEWNHIENTTKNGIHWVNLSRTGTNSKRQDRPGMFYPIFVTEDGKSINSIGQPLPIGIERSTITAPKGCIAVWPIHTDGSEGRWMQGRDGLQRLVEKGFVRLGKFTKTGMAISYLNRAQIEKIESGQYIIKGYAENGAILVDDSKYSATYIPDTQWNIKTHDAARHGTNLINKILGSKRFTFPKSLYAVHDTIRFFVANNPNALIVDFFAGSGTTLHAVNLLNMEDDGRRRCIMVTNNEVSEEEALNLSLNGYTCGDDEWEQFGIARYVTWPRTKYSINGYRDDGTAIDGDYISVKTKEISKSRTFTQIGFIKSFSEMKSADKKQILSIVSKGILPQNLIETDTRFVVSEEEKHTVSILYDDSAVDEWLEALEDMQHIVEFYIITDKKQKFNLIKNEISELLGEIILEEQIKIPMKNGFKTNAKFFKLSFLDKTSVALGRQFKELLPVLWMKGGAIGKCPELQETELPHMLVLENNKMAILMDEIYYPEFEEKMKEFPDIQTVYIVTDSENAYREMIRSYDDKECYQLYRDYLDNFRINTRR